MEGKLSALEGKVEGRMNVLEGQMEAIEITMDGLKAEFLEGEQGILMGIWREAKYL